MAAMLRCLPMELPEVERLTLCRFEFDLSKKMKVLLGSVFFPSLVRHLSLMKALIWLIMDISMNVESSMH